jgi:lipopolysaccharide/colanic/teichoic acid biosynthesis glycosyltransferase
MRYFNQLPGKETEERFIYLLPEEIQNITNSENVLYKEGKFSFNEQVKSNELEENLSEILEEYPNVLRQIKRVINLQSFNYNSCLILRSADIFNISKNKDNSLELILNLHQLNDQRRINKYLIEINKKLKNGGIFIGCFENIRSRYKRFITTYPFFIGHFFYFIDFIWARIFPKIPLLQDIYFSISKGRNRAISFAGGLGRFVYCGFDFIDIFNDELITYIIAIKKAEPLRNITPSYGPLFAMRRVGKGGKEIRVLKFRTMHPYSEFLQPYVYKWNNLENGGKLKDDFRITSWGRIFRKYWIDELPMIFNWLKGDLKLVGVRPLSQHYFNLYPKELQELRIKTKPGLVPPYYVDMPKSFDEIVQSEIRYLEKYFKNPIKTDITYLFKSFYNIIIKKARSK